MEAEVETANYAPSQVFKTWEELEAAAEEKRRELEAKGWDAA